MRMLNLERKDTCGGDKRKKKRKRKKKKERNDVRRATRGRELQARWADSGKRCVSLESCRINGV